MITDYASLVTAVANFAARNDADFTSQVPLFIRFFEDGFSRDMNLEAMFISTTLTPASDGSVTEPTDVANWDSIAWSNGGITGPMSPVTPGFASNVQPNSGVVPRYYYMQNGKIWTVPPGPGSIVLSYYQKLPNLNSTTQTTNWLLAAAPAAYLYGTLLQAIPFLADGDTFGPIWTAAYSGIVDSLTSTDTSRWANAQMRSTGVGP